MYDMERKYPGIGWEKNANELKLFWTMETERHTKGEQILANQRRTDTNQPRNEPSNGWSKVDEVIRNADKMRITDIFGGKQ